MTDADRRQALCVTIDGPSGTGKGTVAQAIARGRGWHYLDSGAIYRVLGLAVERAGLDFADEAAIAHLAAGLDLSFRPAVGIVDVLLAGEVVNDLIRTEEGGRRASKVAVLPSVRAALLQRQRDFLSPPGLVADGRDMGTTVFPNAPLKVYLVASSEERARRRYKQLLEKGLIDQDEASSIRALSRDIEERDRRDSERASSPMRPAEDARCLDSSSLSIEQVLATVNGWIDEVLS